jgi:hypothetical protein
MMKRLFLLALLMTFAMNVQGDEANGLTLTVGTRRPLFMHFLVRKYQMNPKEGIIRVEEDADDASKLTLVGLAVGKCELKVEGLGTQETYNVTVVSDIAVLMEHLEHELRGTGLSVAAGQDKAIIKGEVKRHDDWDMLSRVLGGVDQKRVSNEVIYRPGNDDIQSIKMEIGKRFKLSKEQDIEKLHPGEVHLEMGPVGLTLTCQGITEKRKDELLKILGRFPWLAVEKNADKSKGEVSIWLNIESSTDYDVILNQLEEIVTTSKGVKIQKTFGHIEIAGKVDSGTIWNGIYGILEGASDAELVQNKALFVPSPKAVEELEQLFTDKGYECIKSEKVEKYRQLQIRMLSNNSLSVKGQVSNQEQLNDIMETLKEQKWLAFEGIPSHGQMKLNAPKIDVIPVNLAVDIAVIRVSNGDSKTRGGTKSPLSASVDLGKVLDLVSGRSWGASRTYNAGTAVEDGPTKEWNRSRTSTSSRNEDGHGTFSIGLKSVLNFLDSDHINTSYDAGTVKFMDGTSGEFKNGGTIYMAKMVDENEKMETIEYGLILNVGGTLTTDTMAELEFNLKNSGMEDDVHETEISKSTKLNCRLGETIVVATNMQKQSSFSNDGFPVMRKIPVVKWLAAEETNKKTNVEMLILACPHIDEPAPAGMVINPGNPKEIYDKVENGGKDKGKELNDDGRSTKKSVIKPWTWLGK